MHAEHDGLRAVIAVLTYKRPDDLRELLPTLLGEVNQVNDRVHILVVDNDPAGGASDTVATFSHGPVTYIHEPKPGIAAARNRALDEALGFDLLIFIDDDERPGENWLGHLLETYRLDRPAGVVGPVKSRYEGEIDGWIQDGRFFERRRHRTGTTVDVAATNNLLLDVNVVRFLGIRFNEDFGLTGGSDTLFTRQLTQAGGRLVWCDEAWVVDVVPAARLTRAWVIQRAYRSGNSWSRTSVALASTTFGMLTTRLQLSAKGTARVIGGYGLSLLGLATHSRAFHARGQRTLRRGAGMVAGAWDHVYSEYAR